MHKASCRSKNEGTFAGNMNGVQFSDLNLNASLLNALNDLGYLYPTTIQQKAFAPVMSGRDICGIAQTGTGKTFAYLLPLLRQFKFTKEPHPQFLIIVPTRELVAQVVEETKKLTTYMNVVTVGVYGGANMNKQKQEVENGVDIIVATPGRLLDLMYEGAFKARAIKKLVIDEVDEMLNLGFRPQLKSILELLPAKRQNLLFSATITGEVELLIESFFNNPEYIEAAPVGTPLENIDQAAYLVPNFYTKVNLLEQLLQADETMTRVLIFVATKKFADDLYDHLSAEFPERVGVIHSNKEQNHRFNTVKKFQDGTFRFLIATDIIARGLDVSEVSHVINFDTPDVPENYIHRIGRTGRADKKGISITLVSDREHEYRDAIEALMKYTIPVLPLPDDLEISEELTEDEKPKVQMKTIQYRIPKVEAKGAAFHEKSLKNQKVNIKVSHKEKMQQKYGKPKSRGKKK